MGGSLSPLTNALGNLASPDLPTRLRGALAVEAERQLLAEFRQARDPYGNPWAAVARGGKPLEDTGNLKGSRHFAPAADGVEGGLAAPYAAFQQFGTAWRARAIREASGRFRKAFRRPSARRGGIRPRAMLPFDGLGKIWTAAFEKVAARVLGGR